MDVDRVTGDGDDVLLQPLAGAEQPLVDGANREHHRYGQTAAAGAPVAEDDGTV